MSELNKVVYLHKDSEGVVRYVGSGTVKRANLICANSNRGSKYAEYVKANGKLEVEIISEGLTKLEAEGLEMELFEEHKDTILNHRKPSSAKSMSKQMFEDLLYYDDTSTSCLRWKVDAGNRIKTNSEAGTLCNNGYFQVKVKGITFKVHRIVALLHNLNVDGMVVDHIDRNRSNNKISNIRVVTQKENMQNKSMYELSSNNTSGVQGVSYDKRQNRWTVSWYEDGKCRQKCFPIKDCAVLEAFNDAVEYREQMIEIHYLN